MYRNIAALGLQGTLYNYSFVLSKYSFSCSLDEVPWISESWLLCKDLGILLILSIKLLLSVGPHKLDWKLQGKWGKSMSEAWILWPDGLSVAIMNTYLLCSSCKYIFFGNTGKTESHLSKCSLCQCSRGSCDTPEKLLHSFGGWDGEVESQSGSEGDNWVKKWLFWNISCSSKSFWGGHAFLRIREGLLFPSPGCPSSGLLGLDLDYCFQDILHPAPPTSVLWIFGYAGYSPSD